MKRRSPPATAAGSSNRKRGRAAQAAAPGPEPSAPAVEGPPEAEVSRAPAPRASRRAPPHRRLRVYALDPSLALDFDTSGISAVTLEVPWESGPDGGRLVGPVGEALEVIDVDPLSRRFYEPVDLDDPYVLAQDGHPPSESNPEFHQQMVYAVAATTVRHFEHALGRSMLWADRFERTPQGDLRGRSFVRRLRVYPHALRGGNAFYSPQRKALLFGYFPAIARPTARSPRGGTYDARLPRRDTSVAPGSIVFACLSYDVIAHETAHALLDGLHPRYVEPTNPDVLALHEAFADIVAIFQHFGHRELLADVLAKSRGDLGEAPELAELARQMGHALGLRGALRSALGRPPDPDALSRVTEPHDRGAVLVAAVFDAFLAIYRARVEDLLRIASGGTGVLRRGALHPDLVQRLAGEAVAVAKHVLHMCIRALDYCPPVDPSFGDYLRALITADLDLVPYDRRSYRVAFLEAFRRRGVLPQGLRGLGEDAVRWRAPSEPLPPEVLAPLFGVLRDRQRDSPLEDLAALWTLRANREAIWQAANRVRARLQRGIVEWPERWPGAAAWAERELHLLLRPTARRSVFTDGAGRPTTEVHSARVARRRGPDGESIIELVLEITQRRRGYLSADRQRRVDEGGVPLAPGDAGDFRFRAGCTLLVDLASREVRYAIRSPSTIENDSALARVRRHVSALAPGARATYFGDHDRPTNAAAEPFALLHEPEAHG